MKKLSYAIAEIDTQLYGHWDQSGARFVKGM